MWKDLTLKEKAEIMKMSVANGVTDINDIRALYDGSIGHRFDDAGRIRTITTSGTGYIPPIKQEAIIDAAFDYATGNGKIPIDVVRKRLYDNLYPYGYTSPVTRVHNAVVNNRKEPRIVRNIPDRDDIFAEYLQIPENERHHLPGTMYVRDSEYAPTIGGTNNIKYRKLDLTDAQKEKIILATNPLNFGENRLSKIKHKFDEAKSKPREYTDTQAAAMVLNSYFGEYTLGKGLDPQRGEYRSYYDLWDLSPVSTYGKDETRGIGKPIPFYDRIYLSDYYGVEPQLLLPPKGDYFGKWLPELVVTNKKALGGHLFAKGGSKNKKKGTKGVNYHTNEAQAFVDELIAAGVRPVDAYAAAGNVFVESRFNHEASNNINGGHWGLVQNDANIKRHIIKYYGDYSRNSQMQFLKDGLTGQIKGAKQAPWLQRRFTDYRKHATGVKDASLAAKYFHDDYEKSNNEAVGDRMRAASIYQGHLSGNPTISAYHKMYGKPDLSISNDILYNPAQELKWTNITPTIQQTPWYNNVNSNLVTNDFTPQVKPITPAPIEERFPIEELPDIAPLLSSILPDQRMPSYQQVTVPTYQSPMINFDEPYLLFGR